MDEDLLLTILMVLSADEAGSTTAELGRRLDAGRRTVSRYLKHLRDLGLPIDGVRGKDGYVRLASPMWSEMAALPGPEARRRFLELLRPAPAAAPAEIKEPAPPVEVEEPTAPPAPIEPPITVAAPAIKLVRTSPIEFDPLGWKGEPTDGAKLQTVQQAIVDQHLVSYSSGSARLVIAPLRLFWKAERFFLVAVIDGHLRALPLTDLQDLGSEGAFTNDRDIASIRAAWRSELDARSEQLGRVLVVIRYGWNALQRMSEIEHAAVRKAVLARQATHPPGDKLITIEFPCEDLETFTTPSNPSPALPG